MADRNSLPVIRAARWSVSVYPLTPRGKIYRATARPKIARAAALKEPIYLEADPVNAFEDDDGPGILLPDGRIGDPVAEEPEPAPGFPVAPARPALPVALTNPEDPRTAVELDGLLISRLRGFTSFSYLTLVVLVHEHSVS